MCNTTQRDARVRGFVACNQLALALNICTSLDDLEAVMEKYNAHYVGPFNERIRFYDGDIEMMLYTSPLTLVCDMTGSLEEATRILLDGRLDRLIRH